MSRTHHAPRGVWRIALIGALALAAALMAALSSSPPSAEAAFTSAQCQGADTSGRGASFARDAHQVFRLNFQTFFCPSGPAVDYEALGSGAGRRVVGARTSGSGTANNTDGSNSRNQLPRFGMTDEPLREATDKPQINAGTGSLTAANGDESLIHQIPAAVGAVPMLVNFPDNCDVNLLPAANKTAEQNLDNDATPDDVVRVRFTKVQFEKVWASDGDADNWVELFPDLAPDTDCNKDIIRVVRFDDSGTTFAFKDYLDRILPSRDWITGFTDPAGADQPQATRKWPAAVFGPRPDCVSGGAVQNGPGSEGDTNGSVDQLTSSCLAGNQGVVDKTNLVDGSVGYSDISTARGAGFTIIPEMNDNDKYWVQAQNGAGGTNDSGPLPANVFVETTADPNGFRSDGSPGSNCQSATFVRVPASTLGDWTATTGSNSPTGFGICTLTYGLLFDDYKKAYGLQPDQPGEERRARTVKDYWTSVVSDGGQGVLFGRDYAPLPPSILAIARAGVAAVGYDKAGDGGGGVQPPVVQPPVVQPPLVTPPAEPSNRFSIVRTTLRSRQGTGQFTVRVPNRGTLTLAAFARSGGKRIRVDAVRLTVSRSGTYKLNLKPGRAAKRILARRGRLGVRVRITFTPRGGRLRAVNRTVTLRLTRRVRRR